jgi:hypothetical protein
LPHEHVDEVILVDDASVDEVAHPGRRSPHGWDAALQIHCQPVPDVH